MSGIPVTPLSEDTNDDEGCCTLFTGRSIGNICAFNGLPFFSRSGQEWIKARTGDVPNFDKYFVLSPPELPSRGAAYSKSRRVLPDKASLLQSLEKYRSSEVSQFFPLIDPELFKHTIKSAYEQKRSGLSPSIHGSKACVFGLMALVSYMCSDEVDNNQMTLVTQEWAGAANSLIPEIIAESVSLDGLQAILMLVS